MGQFIKLPAVKAAASRPKVDLLDPVVPDSGGLLLIEPAHPVSPWLSGSPASGGSVPNVIGSLAAPLLGSDTSALGATVRETDPTNLIVTERSAKGGMHIAVAQAGSTFPTNTFWRVEMADAIKQYLLANPTHAYYLGVTARITRIGLGGPFFMSTIAATGSSYLGTVFADQFATGTRMGTYPNKSVGASTFTGSRIDSAVDGSATPLKLGNVGVTGWQGAFPTTIAGFSAHAMQAGQTPPVNAGTSAKYPSLLFYRTYLEDLTVSKRSWAQVDAAEFANYQRQFAAGGRYANDTWTNPATLVA